MGCSGSLLADPGRVDDVARMVLDRSFPHSLHEDILDAVGFSWRAETQARPARDPEFRATILRIYEQRCAACGFDGRLGRTSLGLEAAHVKWFAAGGPDTPANGLCLCSLHHRALDLGAIGIDDDLRLVVSEHVAGGEQVEAAIVALRGQPLRAPLDGWPRPEREFVAWHRSEVFRAPARR